VFSAHLSPVVQWANVSVAQPPLAQQLTELQELQAYKICRDADTSVGPIQQKWHLMECKQCFHVLLAMQIDSNNNFTSFNNKDIHPTPINPNQPIPLSPDKDNSFNYNRITNQNGLLFFNNQRIVSLQIVTNQKQSIAYPLIPPLNSQHHLNLSSTKNDLFQTKNFIFDRRPAAFNTLIGLYSN